MTPGPTRVPERVLARRRAADDPPSHAGVLARARVGDRAAAPLFGTQRPTCCRSHDRPRRARGDDLQSLLAGDEIVACCNGKFGEMWAGVRRVVRAGRPSRVRRTGARASIPTEVDAALARASANARGDGRVQRYVDRRANDVAAVARVTRSRGVARHGGRHSLTRRHAIRVRRVGRRRRRHGIAEVSDGEPRPRVRRGERARLDGVRVARA